MSPTIVRFHGAVAESASAAAISDLVRTAEEPVVLVAHHYGGAVISNVDA